MSKNNEVNTWFGERPEEPQLPLYALLDPQNTVGITFAQVFTGEHRFKGISQYSLEIEGIKPISKIKSIHPLSWEAQLNEWRTLFIQLSNDFYHGIATVDPKEAVQTCMWCALKPFCRINEEVEYTHEC